MGRVLVTGMSGTGKSTALDALSALGHTVVDTDWPGWSEEVPLADGSGWEQLWVEDRMHALLADPEPATLFVAGSAANQVRFHDRFDAIVLLSAPLPVILDRVATRSTNPFGSTEADRQRITADWQAVEPLLRAVASHEIDTTLPPGEVVDALVAIAQGSA